MTDGFEGSELTHGTFESVIPGKTIAVKLAGKVNDRLDNLKDAEATTAAVNMGDKHQRPADNVGVVHGMEPGKDPESLPPVLEYAQVPVTGSSPDEPERDVEAARPDEK
jgi:hypothetical protein